MNDNVPSQAGSNTPPALPASSSPSPSSGMIVAGILFIIVWLGGCYLWGMMSLLVLAMANDSGAMPSEDHARMILVCLSGQAITAIAGILCGLSFFWRKKRKLLLILFSIMLVVGVAMQTMSVVRFINKATALEEAKKSQQQTDTPSPDQNQQQNPVQQDESL